MWLLILCFVASATAQDNTEAMKESSNSLVMSNNVDGLKGETDDLSDGKQAKFLLHLKVISFDVLNVD